MTFKGNLRDFTITQILNLINLAQKTGSLIVERPSEAAWMFFRDGKLAYAQMGQEDSSLVTILYKANKINQTQYRAIKERTAHMSDKELGLLLINANYITQQDILTSLQSFFVDVVHRLYTWGEGLFRFDNDLTPPDDKIAVRINLENLIIEGSRRLQEWERLQDEIPSLEMALKFADRPGANIRNVSLSVEEWRVVSYINPKNTMRQIARTTKMNDLEIRRIAYGLLQAGLVEIIRPAGIPATAALPQGREASTMPVVQPAPINIVVQKSLINRIINRLRNL